MYQRPPIVSPLGPGGSVAGPSGYCHSPPAPNAGLDVMGPVTFCGGCFVKSVAVHVVGPPLPLLAVPVDPVPDAPGLPLSAPVPKSHPCALHPPDEPAEVAREQGTARRSTAASAIEVASRRTSLSWSQR